MSIRRRALTRAFELLYGPLVLLHEPLGGLVYGPSWKGRRLALVADLPDAAVVIEVGSGEGRLVRHLDRLAVQAIGYEPSPAMRQRAWRRGIPLVSAPAERLPVPDGIVDMILITYPGPWIFGRETWCEFARVLRVGGEVRILVGGRLGNRSVRSWLLRLVYGSNAKAPASIDAAGVAGIDGGWKWISDAWGAALVWSGTRSVSRRSVVN